MPTDTARARAPWPPRPVRWNPRPSRRLSLSRPPSPTAGYHFQPGQRRRLCEGEVITVALTFSEAVTVTANPGSPRGGRAQALGAVLRRRRRNPDLRLQGQEGGCRRRRHQHRGRPVAAQRREHRGRRRQRRGPFAPALPAQAGHKVDGSQAAPADGQQQPPANSPSSLRTLRRPSIWTRTRRWARAWVTRLPPSTATATC